MSKYPGTVSDHGKKDQMVNMDSLSLVSSISLQQKRYSGNGGLDKLSDRMKQIEDSIRRVTNDVEHLKRLQKDKTEKQIDENTLIEWVHYKFVRSLPIVKSCCNFYYSL